MYTVKEVSELSKVTIKTLHHYHKIGLLLPGRISDAGYRLYGTKEQQEALLLSRKDRLDTIVQTLRKSIGYLKDGENMDNKEMFNGFDSEREWEEVLIPQNQYLKESYGMDALEVVPEDVQNMNEQAIEGMTFMNNIASSLRDGVKHNDKEIENLIRDHLEFMNEHGHNLSAKDFAAQTKFFLSDDFHLKMLESQQTGLAYYLSAAAESFAATNQ